MASASTYGTNHLKASPITQKSKTSLDSLVASQQAQFLTHHPRLNQITQQPVSLTLVLPTGRLWMTIRFVLAVLWSLLFETFYANFVSNITSRT
jgi:hypothetical protein